MSCVNMSSFLGVNIFVVINLKTVFPVRVIIIFVLNPIFRKLVQTNN